MCLYPKLIPNKRYLPTKKNGGIPPVCPDERLRYVTAACGDCYECRKQKQRQWVVRMSEENRQTPNAYYLTLTIDDKSYKQISKKYKLKDDNDIATKAIRLCLEREERLKKDKETAETTLDNKYSLMAQQFASYGVMINQMESSFSGLKMLILQSQASR